MDTEDWKDYRAEQQKRRQSRLKHRTDQIMTICYKLNLSAKRLTEYQIRIENKLDIFPIHLKFLILATGKRGQIYSEEQIEGFIKNRIK